MKLSHDVKEALDKLGSLSMTTLDRTVSGDPTLHSRIISVCGSDGDGIYFLTMNSKPFYRQLKANPLISLCGIYPSGEKTGTNAVGQPSWKPGFTLRITGEALELEEGDVKKKAAAGSAIHQFFLEDQSRYPAIRFFCIHKGRGEIFDYDFELENRDHKVLRTRFAFGGETVNPAGARISPEDCIACGECLEACTFKAITAGEPYSIDGSRCDECGSCIDICPQNAIDLPLTI